MVTVLLADDDVHVRKYLDALIADLGYNAIPVATCEEAIARLADSKVDIIIADILLPDCPGPLEWEQQLVRAAQGRPLILIAGDTSEEVVAAGSRKEVMALLTKPFELSFVRDLLKQAESLLADSEGTDA